jgi:photosystem II stability/assembly factor-like uncharacterized protein
MLRHLRFVSLCAVLMGLASSGSLVGQSQTAIPIATEFEGLHFRSIGPATMSGRISDVAVYEPNPAIYYVGTAHGGVWKTVNNGTLFEALFQDIESTKGSGLISIGDVAVSQKDPNLVWVGTGESNNRQTTSWGDGVYKSTDGGKTWQHMGLRQSYHINRIVIDPDDNNTVYVAATGALFGPGGERGVYKTTDGGKTWKQTLKVDDDTGANDLVMADTDHRIMYASTYQRRRTQCCMNGGGPGSGIWKSTDAGENWTRLTNGIPPGSLGRIGLDVYRRSANIVYATIEAEGGGGGGRGGGEELPGAAAAGGAAGAGAAGGAAGAAGGAAGGGAAGGGAAGRGGRGGAGRGGDPAVQGGGGGGGAGGGGASGLYRSDDGGATWRRVSTVNPRPMYFSQVRIDPNNPDVVVFGGVDLQMTMDGGKTVNTQAASVIHSDHHAIWIDPSNSNHILIGNDGGLAVSYDQSKTWSFLPNLPVGLFYHVGYDMQTPYNVCGGMQDNYNWCGPSATRFSRGIANYDWFQVQGGDGFVTIIDPRDPRIVYTESQNGNMTRRNTVTGESKSIRPTNENVEPDTQGQYRFNWDTPIVFSPHEPGTLIVAAHRVFRSSDRGDSWNVISGDLTTNADRNEIVTMGLRGNEIRIARDDGISAWPTIVSLAESPKQPGLMFTGSDDGVVSVSRDGGKTWQNITKNLPGFPQGAWVSEVVPSRFEAGTVYVTVDAHRLNNYETFIWVSNDFGATFRSLNGNLKGEAVKTLTEDLKNPDILYIGTETGLFLTLDRGKSWRRLKANLPTVRVDEITLHPRDNAMIVATHGRALWILDHLEPIQEYAAAQAAEAKLFTPGPALLWKQKDDRNDEFWGHQFFIGENPPAEAIIQFNLKNAAKDVKLKVTDATGKEVRELTVPANRSTSGIQTTCWDMRVDPIPAGPGGGQPPAGRGGGGGGGGGGRAAGPPPAGLPGTGFLNPCTGATGGGGGGGGGGRGGGGGANQGPHVMPGTYNVALIVDGKTIDTKPLKIVSDPGVTMTDVQRRRYNEIVMDLHDIQRRGMQMTNALNPFYTQMSDIAGKIGGMSNVPAPVKAQFDALNKEFDAVRVKFGVPPPAPPQGGRGGGGGGFGGGGGGSPADLVSRTANLKGAMAGIWEMPSDALVKQYNDVKLALPKALADANALLVKAMPVSQALKKYDLALTVPSPVK